MLRFVNPIKTVKVCSITCDFCELVNNRKRKTNKQKNNDIRKAVCSLSEPRSILFSSKIMYRGSC